MEIISSAADHTGTISVNSGLSTDQVGVSKELDVRKADHTGIQTMQLGVETGSEGVSKGLDVRKTDHTGTQYVQVDAHANTGFVDVKTGDTGVRADAGHIGVEVQGPESHAKLDVLKLGVHGGSTAKAEMFSGDLASPTVIQSDPFPMNPESSQSIHSYVSSDSPHRSMPLNSITGMSLMEQIPPSSQDTRQAKFDTVVDQRMMSDAATDKTLPHPASSGKYFAADGIQKVDPLDQASDKLLEGSFRTGLDTVAGPKMESVDTKSANDFRLLSSSNVAQVDHQDAVAIDAIQPVDTKYRPVNSGPLHPDGTKEKSHHNKTKKTEKTVQQVTTKNITLPGGHKVVETKTKTVEVKVTETTNLSAEKNGAITTDVIKTAAELKAKPIHPDQAAASSHDPIYKPPVDAIFPIEIGTDLAATGDHLGSGIDQTSPEMYVDFGSAGVDQTVGGFDSVVDRSLNSLLHETPIRESAKASHEVRSVTRTIHDPLIVSADAQPELAADIGHGFIDASAIDAAVSGEMSTLDKVSTSKHRKRRKGKGRNKGTQADLEITSRKAKINISHGTSNKIVNEIDLTASKPDIPRTDVAFIIVDRDGHSPVLGLGQAVGQMNPLEISPTGLMTGHSDHSSDLIVHDTIPVNPIETGMPSLKTTSETVSFKRKNAGTRRLERPSKPKGGRTFRRESRRGKSRKNSKRVYSGDLKMDSRTAVSEMADKIHEHSPAPAFEGLGQIPDHIHPLEIAPSDLITGHGDQPSDPILADNILSSPLETGAPSIVTTFEKIPVKSKISDKRRQGQSRRRKSRQGHEPAFDGLEQIADHIHLSETAPSNLITGHGEQPSDPIFADNILSSPLETGAPSKVTTFAQKIPVKSKISGKRRQGKSSRRKSRQGPEPAFDGLEQIADQIHPFEIAPSDLITGHGDQPSDPILADNILSSPLETGAPSTVTTFEKFPVKSKISDKRRQGQSRRRKSRQGPDPAIDGLGQIADHINPLETAPSNLMTVHGAQPSDPILADNIHLSPLETGSPSEMTMSEKFRAKSIITGKQRQGKSSRRQSKQGVSSGNTSKGRKIRRGKSGRSKSRKDSVQLSSQDHIKGSVTRVSDIASDIQHAASLFDGDIGIQAPRQSILETGQSRDRSIRHDPSLPPLQTDSLIGSGTGTATDTFDIPGATTLIEDVGTQSAVRKGARPNGRERAPSSPTSSMGLTEGLRPGRDSRVTRQEMRGELGRLRRGQDRLSTGRPIIKGDSRLDRTAMPRGSMDRRSGRLIIEAGDSRYNPSSGFSVTERGGRLGGSERVMFEPTARGRYQFSSGGVVGVPDNLIPDLRRITVDPRARGRYHFTSGGAIGVPDVPFTQMPRMVPESTFLRDSRDTLLSRDNIIGRSRDGQPIYVSESPEGHRLVTEPGTRPMMQPLRHEAGRRRDVDLERQSVRLPQRRGRTVSRRRTAADKVDRGTLQRTRADGRGRSSPRGPEVEPRRLKTRERVRAEIDTRADAFDALADRRTVRTRHPKTTQPGPAPRRLETRTRPPANIDTRYAALADRRTVRRTSADRRRRPSTREPGLATRRLETRAKVLTKADARDAALADRITEQRTSAGKRGHSRTRESDTRSRTRTESNARDTALADRRTLRRISAGRRGRSRTRKSDTRPRTRTDGDASRVVSTRPWSHIDRRNIISATGGTELDAGRAVRPRSRSNSRSQSRSRSNRINVIAAVGGDIQRLRARRLRGDTSTPDAARRVRLGPFGSGEVVGSPVTIGGSRYIPVEVPYTYDGRILPGGARYLMPPVPYPGMPRTSPMLTGRPRPLRTLPRDPGFMRPLSPFPFPPPGYMFR